VNMFGLFILNDFAESINNKRNKLTEINSKCMGMAKL